MPAQRLRAMPERHYAADVEPWLGDRFAVALVPAPDAEEGFAPVLALAVNHLLFTGW